MKIGLFIAYSPRTKFENQGLGRQFIKLVEGFHGLSKEPVTIVCPSWLRSDVKDMFSGMPPGSIEVVGNQTIPVLLRVHKLLMRSSTVTDTRPPLANRIRSRLRAGYVRILLALEKVTIAGLSSTKTVAVVAALALLLALGLVAIVLLPLAIVFSIGAFAGYWGHRKKLWIRFRAWLEPKAVAAKSMLYHIAGGRVSSFRRAIYDRMVEWEMDHMISVMHGRTDIDIWYSPTVFWPAINSAPVPTVQCFPDIVMADFPTSFATKYPASISQFNDVRRAVETGGHFVAYSASTAKAGLQARFDVSEDRIHVIPHAAMDLSSLIGISGTLDDKFARRKFATNLIEGHRNAHWQENDYLKNFNFSDTQYIFYASQLRPNKNAMNLVRAYEDVLRSNYKYVKLILTARLEDDPELLHYIYRRRLQYDIISAHDVPPQVLAALYHRAEIAVNPSLFEGGMPFTFTEALSVGTPVVMARIPQTIEVMGDGEVALQSLFDPWDIADMTKRITYGLEHRQQLLELQLPLFNHLKSRTWVDVAEDHIEAFKKILAA